MAYDFKILITSNLKFLSSLYLSSVPQLNVGCFIVTPMLCLGLVCSLVIFAFVCFFFIQVLLNLPLRDYLFWVCLMCVSYICVSETFHSWHHVAYLALCEDNTCLCLDASLLLYANNADLQYACVLIYIDVEHYSWLYMWCSLVNLYTKLGHVCYWLHPLYYYLHPWQTLVLRIDTCV